MNYCIARLSLDFIKGFSGTVIVKSEGTVLGAPIIMYVFIISLSTVQDLEQQGLTASGDRSVLSLFTLGMIKAPFFYMDDSTFSFLCR